MTNSTDSFRRWTEQIPAEFQPPADGSPRARILGAAAEHFAAAGFSGSATRAIAETAGVNQAMIHYYFQSKTRLYERVLAGIVVELLSSLASSISPRSGAPADVLVELPERIVAVFASDPVRVSIFRREIGNGAPHLRAVVDSLGAAGPRGFRVLMTEFIEAARADGAVVAESATATLSFLLVHAYGTLLVEPMLRHVLGADDSPENLTRLMSGQRDLVRRALTGTVEEENE